MSTNTERQAIEKVLFAYRDALNASDVSKVVPLYTQGGLLMQPNAPTAVGPEEIRNAYGMLFKNVQLTLEFFVDEAVVTGEYAYLRTHSSGSALIHANDTTMPVENKELFLLLLENRDWKISHYMFNQSK